MDRKIKNIYLSYMKVYCYPEPWYWRPAVGRKFLRKLNIKRKPKRAKREELAKLYEETFYKQVNNERCKPNDARRVKGSS